MKVSAVGGARFRRHVRPARLGRQLLAAQRVGAESPAPAGSRRAGLGGQPWLASADCFFLSSFIKAVCRLPRRRTY